MAGPLVMEEPFFDIKEHRNGQKSEAQQLLTCVPFISSTQVTGGL
jgi:hypothetical protein